MINLDFKRKENRKTTILSKKILSFCRTQNLATLSNN